MQYLRHAVGPFLLIFHAQNLAHGGMPFAWIKKLSWTND